MKNEILINSDITIQNFLNNLESELEIKILYACETGSRAVGVHVEDSDFDVKGFYVAKENEYLRVARSINPIFIKHHMTININEEEFDIDVEFRDIREYFYSKITSNTARSDFWFESEIIYINLFSDEILKVIKQYSNSPIHIFSPNDKSGIKSLEKYLKNNQSLLNKKLLSLIISAIHFFHLVLYEHEFNKNMNTEFRKFPQYNIFKEIEYLKQNKNNIKEILNEDENEILEKNLFMVEGFYQRKKIDRLSTTLKIPENLILFLKMLNEKFKSEEKRKEMNKIICELPIDWAEEKFEYFLNKYENMN